MSLSMNDKPVFSHRSASATRASDDGWTFVTRGPRRKKRDVECREHNENGPVFQYKEITSVALNMQRLPSPIDWQTIRDGIVVNKTRLSTSQWWSQLHPCFVQAFGKNKVEFMQCLGLGSIERSTSSRHQLACILLLKETLGNVPCSVSDPLLTQIDHRIINSFGLTVKPAQSIYDIDICTGCGVLFMPHCGEELNIAVLSRWINRGDVTNVVLLGNKLSQYIRGDADTSLIASLVTDGRLVEQVCPDPKLSTFEAAFNDLCITRILPKRGTPALPVANPNANSS